MIPAVAELTDEIEGRCLRCGVLRLGLFGPAELGLSCDSIGAYGGRLHQDL